MQLGKMQQTLMRDIGYFLYRLHLASRMDVVEINGKLFISIIPYIVFEDMMIDGKDDISYTYEMPDESSLDLQKVFELTFDISKQYIHKILEGNRKRVKTNEK